MSFDRKSSLLYLKDIAIQLLFSGGIVTGLYKLGELGFLNYGFQGVISGVIGFVALIFYLRKYFNGKANYCQPDLTGKVIIITGANSGLGLNSLKEIVKLNPKKVILACRNFERGNKALQSVQRELNVQNLQLMRLDLGDLNSVKKFASDFKNQNDRLDILLNNAGVFCIQQRELTSQGFEKQFGINHLGHFLLTYLLTDILKSTENSRVVNVSSIAHLDCKQINFDDLMFENHKYSASEAYYQSKLANMLHARQLHLNGMNACSLHPGVVRTQLFNNLNTGSILAQISFGLLTPFWWLFTKTAWYGAQTQLYCCLCPNDEFKSGDYYSDQVPYHKKSKTLNLPDDWKEQSQELWNKSLELCKDYL